MKRTRSSDDFNDRPVKRHRTEEKELTPLGIFPVEIWQEIAGVDIPTYYALLLAVPGFARSITRQKRIAYQTQFGAWKIDENKNKIWKVNGMLYCEDGHVIEKANGIKEWYYHGKVHREDGPAVEYNNTMEWYHHGKRHRKDGPAVIWFNGNKEWWINGKKISPPS